MAMGPTAVWPSIPGGQPTNPREATGPGGGDGAVRGCSRDADKDALLKLSEFLLLSLVVKLAATNSPTNRYA